MRILVPGNLTKKTASESVQRVIFSGSFLSLIARQQNSNYKWQVYFDTQKKLECNSVRQFNEYVNHYDADLLESVLSKVRFRFVAGIVRANFFRCHNDKITAAYGIFSV
jgi:hypothetical protein